MPEKNVQVNTDRGLPYERFLQFGPENLTEAELLAVILRTGTKEDSAVALAEKVLALATYPREGLLGLHDVSVEELMEIRGIGMVKAVKLKCIAELSNRMSRAKAREGICFTSGSCGGIFYGKTQTQGYRMCVSALSGCQRTADP